MIFTYIHREFEHKMIENVSCGGPKKIKMSESYEGW